MSWDCIIVGGGPAGLSAAVMLGRCRRRVLLCDMGEQRNLRSHAMHGYLTRDGVSPAEFLRLARAELGRYGTVECRELEIVEATREDGGFAVCAADGTRLNTRKLLLATGVIDELPAIEGLDALYGTAMRLTRNPRDLFNTLAVITGIGAGGPSLGDAWADTTTDVSSCVLSDVGEREAGHASGIALGLRMPSLAYGVP